jgi:hypothetical protein
MKFTRRFCALTGPLLFAIGLTAVACGGAKQESAGATQPSSTTESTSVTETTVSEPGVTETTVTATPVVTEPTGVTNMQPKSAQLSPTKAPIREGSCLSQDSSCSRNLECCSQWCANDHCATRKP